MSPSVCCWVGLTVLVVCHQADAAPSEELISTKDGRLKWLENINEACVSKEYITCVGVKAVSMLNRASSLETVQIIEGLHFVKTDENDIGESLLRNEADIENIINGQVNDNKTELINVMVQSVNNFFKTHTLKADLQVPVPFSDPDQTGHIQSDPVTQQNMTRTVTKTLRRLVRYILRLFRPFL